MTTTKKRPAATLRLLIGLTAVMLLVSGCILQPDSGNDTGTITLALPDSEVSASGLIGAGDLSNASHARVWLYRNGSEYSIGEAAADFEEVAAAGGARVVIEGVPAGDGYSVVVVFGVKDATDTSGVFAPLSYAQSNRFPVQAERETVVSIAEVALTGDEDSPFTSVQFQQNLFGENLVSVVRYTSGGGGIAVASPTTVWDNADVGAGSPSVVTPGSAGRIYSISEDSAGDSDFLINAENGLFGNGGSLVAGFPTELGNITDSGSFNDGTNPVYFYQRLGGLGGAAPAGAGNWFDSGTELEDYVAADQSPVRAQAVLDLGSEDSRAFVSTVLGTFAFDQDFVTDDIEVGDLLDPDDDTDGLTFFGVAYPGESAPLRIEALAVVADAPETVVVGTSRGAFAFPVSALDSLSQSGLVPSPTELEGTLDQPVIDIEVSTDGDGSQLIAVLTRNRWWCTTHNLWRATRSCPCPPGL